MLPHGSQTSDKPKNQNVSNRYGAKTKPGGVKLQKRKVPTKNRQRAGPRATEPSDCKYQAQAVPTSGQKQEANCSKGAGRKPFQDSEGTRQRNHRTARFQAQNLKVTTELRLVGRGIHLKNRCRKADPPLKTIIGRDEPPLKSIVGRCNPPLTVVRRSDPPSIFSAQITPFGSSKTSISL